MELGVGVGVAGDVVVVAAAAVDDVDARSFRWKSELQKDIVLKIEKKTKLNICVLRYWMKL